MTGPQHVPDAGSLVVGRCYRMMKTKQSGKKKVTFVQRALISSRPVFLRGEPRNS